jgi:L-serine dehydratase
MIALIIKAKVSVSGAQHGCEAECGVGRAMAAAMETEVKKGDPTMVINAVSRAIIQSLGLPCDPVGGLVEIPCIERNGVYAAAAHTDAAMSLAGFQTIPPEEVLKVMDEVGKDLNEKYKEGKIGPCGLAGTQTGLLIFDNLKKNSLRYKIPYVRRTIKVLEKAVKVVEEDS